MDRINLWVDPEEDKDLITALLTSANRFFSIEKMEVWLNQINRWIGSQHEEVVKIGLRALQVVLIDPKFVNSQKIYSLLEPVILHPVFSLQKELLTLMELLVNHSEMETTAFLRSILTKTDDTEVIRFIRRCLPLLQPASQASLKLLLNPSP